MVTCGIIIMYYVRKKIHIKTFSRNYVIFKEECDMAEINIKKSRNNFIRLINNIQKCSGDGTYIKRLYNINEFL